MQQNQNKMCFVMKCCKKEITMPDISESEPVEKKR